MKSAKQKSSGTKVDRPENDWRDWRSHVADIDRYTGGKIFDDSPSGQAAFIVSICQYVWDSAKGNEPFRHECVEKALREAGFAIDRSGTRNMLKAGSKYGTVSIRGAGIAERELDPKTGFEYTFTRLHEDVGFLGAVASLFGIEW